MPIECIDLVHFVSIEQWCSKHCFYLLALQGSLRKFRTLLDKRNFWRDVTAAFLDVIPMDAVDLTENLTVGEPTTGNIVDLGRNDDE